MKWKHFQLKTSNQPKEWDREREREKGQKTTYRVNGLQNENSDPMSREPHRWLEENTFNEVIILF